MDTTDADIQELISDSFADFKSSFETGEKIRGVISSITRANIFVDINSKGEGIIDKNEFIKDGKLSIKIGDEIDAYFAGIGTSNELLLTVSRKIKQEANDDSIQEALSAGIPIEGKVVSERNGGFEIKIGNHSGFCPYSQIDLFPGSDKSVYLGHRLSFMIQEYSGDNLVVSRRKCLEAEKSRQLEEHQNSLNEGDIVEGTVTNILDFGAFVDIGGLDGLVPIQEISWKKVKNIADEIKPQSRVAVKILKINWDDNKILLSIKQAGKNPWDDIEDKFHETRQYTGTVTNLKDFGAFVAIDDGIEGLIHISKLGAGKRLKHASEVLKEDEEIQVYIESIDLEKKRLSFTLENPKQGRTLDVEGEKITIGEEKPGIVEGIKQYGIFVKFSSSRTGLLHVSEIPFEGHVNKIKNMYDRFPPGSDILVIIKNIQKNKISLSLPGSNDNNDDDYREFLASETNQNEFNSIGDAFDDLTI